MFLSKVGGGGQPEAAGADRREQEVAGDAQERRQHVSFSDIVAY